MLVNTQYTDDTYKPVSEEEMEAMRKRVEAMTVKRQEERLSLAPVSSSEIH